MVVVVVLVVPDGHSTGPEVMPGSKLVPSLVDLQKQELWYRGSKKLQDGIFWGRTFLIYPINTFL